MTTKFQTTKKELADCKKENKELHSEVMQLQANIRSMVPGFQCTGSSFPLFAELQNEVSEFLKCDSQDCFFDILSPELNLDGVVYFFKHAFGPLQKQVQNYFEPLLSSIEQTACIETTEGPVNNVLKKVYQQNYEKMFDKCFTAV